MSVCIEGKGERVKRCMCAIRERVKGCVCVYLGGDAQGKGKGAVADGNERDAEKAIGWGKRLCSVH